MRSVEEPETAVRARTRAAVLDAAAHVWARDFSAPLGEVAERARVSRSTMRRYFPDREALVDALRVQSRRLLLDAAARARVDGSEPLVALERLMRLAVDHHERILFLFADPNRFADDPGEDPTEEDTTLLDLIERAQAQNLLRAWLTARWIQSSFYATVHTAAESIADGHLTPSEAADAAVHTLLSGVGGNDPPARGGLQS